MATLGRAGAPATRSCGAVREGAGAELHAVGISLDYTPVLDVLTNPKNPSSATGRWPTAPTSRAARIGDHPRLQERASPPAGNTFWTRRYQRRLALRDAAAGSSARSARGGGAGAVQAAIAAGVASIMTAHILILARRGAARHVSPATRRRSC